ncbi:MAG: MBL fold metallo-hydrolase, partial [Pedobacter sp.]
MISLKKFTFNPYQENTYVLFDETGECVIIDPGMYNGGEQNQIVSFIKEHNLKPVLLLNTHCHIDHVLGNK